MAESFRERRKRELAGAQSPAKENDGLSFRERRKKELRSAVDIYPSETFTGTRQPLQPMVSQTDYKALGEKINKDKPKEIRVKEPTNKNNQDEKQAIQDFLDRGNATRDRKDPKNPILDFIKDNTVDRIGQAGDWLQVKTPAGRIIPRVGDMAGKVMGIDTQAANAAPVFSTGNKEVDALSDLAGVVGGLFADPTVPVQAAASLQGVGTALKNTGVGKLVGKVTNKRALNSEIKNFIGRTKGPEAPQTAPISPVNVNATSIEPTQPPAEDWFSRLFGQQGVGVTAGARSGKEMIDTHIVGNARQKGAAAERVGEVAAKAEQEMVDKFAPFRQINNDTYNAAMDSTRANNLANVTIKDKFVDLEGNVIGKSLKDVYTNVPRGKKNIADRYTIMRDAVSRMERGIKVYGGEAWFPKTAAEASQMVAKMEERNPWLIQFGKDWNGFNINRQNLWVQSGIASQDLVNTLRYTNPNYAPMQRQQPRGSLKSRLMSNSGKEGFSGQRAPVKRAVGSSKKIVDPVKNMIESTGTSYNAMMRNRAMIKMYDAVRADPERYRGILEIVEESAEMKKMTLDEINTILREEGLEGVVGKLNGELDSIFKKAKQATGRDEGIVTVMVNGDPVKMRVAEPSLLKAIDGIAPEQLGVALKIANTISKAIKMSATGLLAPVQGAKLALRDLPIAFAQSKDKKRFLYDISHAFISQAGDWLPDFVPGSQKLGNLARQYYRAGGGYEAYLKGDSNIRSVSSDLTRDPILSGRNMVKTVRKANPLRPLKAFGDGLENVPRIAAFAAEMRKRGWSRDPESVRAAVDAGREATVNWSRRGAKGAGIEAVLPYSNAAVQGTYRLVKRFKEQPISATLLIMGIAGAKIASYEKFKDDQEYQQRSKFEKGIPISKDKNGKFVTQPVEPTEAYLADQILHFYKWAMDGQKAPGAKEIFKEGTDALLPKYASGPLATFATPGEAVDPRAGLNATLSGSVVEPANAAVSGKNFFGGDIVPREYQGLPIEEQNDSTTSAAGKWAAENLNIDAFTFDYLGEKFGGDIAKIGLPMTSDVGKADPTGNLWDETLTRLKLLEDPVMKNRIADDFFNQSEAVTQAKASESRKDKPLPPWYQAAYDHVTSTKKGSITSSVQGLNSTKKDIERDLTLSAKERADRLRDVQREINLLRIEGIKIMEELGVPKRGQ